MTRQDYENCIFNLFVQTILTPASDIQKNIENCSEDNDGENYYDLLRELMNTMNDKELIHYYNSVIQYLNRIDFWKYYRKDNKCEMDPGYDDWIEFYQKLGEKCEMDPGYDGDDA